MKSVFKVVACWTLSLIALTSCNFSNGTTHKVVFDSNGGSPVKSQKVKHGEKIEKPTDPTRDGYTFNNWTYNEEEWSFIGYVVTEDMTLLANWNANVYTLTLNNSNPEIGNISGAGTYNYDSDVTVVAVPTTGYSFVGWYDSKNSLISNQSIYTFKMGFDLTLTAKWNEGNEYLATLDPNGGILSQTTVIVNYGKVYNFPIPERKGYTFKGWYDDSVMINDTGTWLYTSSKTFIAKWSIVNYTITYNLNGGINNSSNPSTYTVNDNVTFAAPNKQGYEFDGWYKDYNLITNIPVGSTGNIIIEAGWKALMHNLIVTSEDNSKGTVTIVSGTGYTDESITVVAYSAKSCMLAGWFNGNTRVSNLSTYTFKMPHHDYSLVAHFYSWDEQVALGIIPSFGSTMLYGLYPRSCVDDLTLISSLNSLSTPDINGWYLFENTYYAKTTATPFQDNYKFENGTTISYGETYWFKCEPIAWRGLSSNNDGNYYLLSSFLLDVHCFHSPTATRIIDGQTIYPNNYRYSSIRSWLNGDFYNSAFALGDSHIQIATVDNSETTTSVDTYPPKNRYICENTEDKVFLPSLRDYFTPDYGFASSNNGGDKNRECKTTDWSRARGAKLSYDDSPYGFNGAYYTRSPYYRNIDLVSYISYDSCGGNLSCVGDFGTRIGIIIRF